MNINVRVLEVPQKTFVASVSVGEKRVVMNVFIERGILLLERLFDFGIIFNLLVLGQLLSKKKL